MVQVVFPQCVHFLAFLILKGQHSLILLLRHYTIKWASVKKQPPDLLTEWEDTHPKSYCKKKTTILGAIFCIAI